MTDQPQDAAVHDQPSTPAPAPRGSHAGVIIGSIVGGVLVLGLTFGGGAVVGWVVGTHHGQQVAAAHHTIGTAQGRLEARQKREQREQHRKANGQPSTPSPAPSATPTL